MKWEQRKLNEQGNALIDMGKMHAELNEQLFEMQRVQEAVLAQVRAPLMHRSFDVPTRHPAGGGPDSARR